jgi:hypothetical protein
MSQFEVSFSVSNIKCTSTPKKRIDSSLHRIMPKTSTVVDIQAALKPARFSPIEEPSKIEFCLSTTTRLSQKKSRPRHAPICCSSFAKPKLLDHPQCSCCPLKRVIRKSNKQRSDKKKHIVSKLTKRIRDNCFYLPECLTKTKVPSNIQTFDKNAYNQNHNFGQFSTSFFTVYYL